MICDCGKKMQVKFTTPIDGTLTRYRLYKCSNCKETQETLELLGDTLKGEAERAALRRGRESRFRFYKKLKG